MTDDDISDEDYRPAFEELDEHTRTRLLPLIEELKQIEEGPIGRQIDPDDDLCWFSLGVGFFLARGEKPIISNAAAVAARYGVRTS